MKIPMSYDRWCALNVEYLCNCRAVACPFLSNDPAVTQYASAGGPHFCMVLRAKYNDYVHDCFDGDDEAAKDYFVEV